MKILKEEVSSKDLIKEIEKKFDSYANLVFLAKTLVEDLAFSIENEHPIKHIKIEHVDKTGSKILKLIKKENLER